MKDKKQLYCHLQLEESDNTCSLGKQWKTVFISYLSHILDKNYQTKSIFISDKAQLQEYSISRDKDSFLSLQVLSSQSLLKGNRLNSNEEFSSLFGKTESIGLLKEPIENLPGQVNELRIFDFCPIDAETGIAIKAEDLFEKDNLNLFLSKIADLAFEIDLLLNNANDPTVQVPYIYLAEASYELSQIRYSVKKELIRRGYRVLPEIAFPVEKEKLTDYIRQDLKKSILSVHFFGTNNSAPHPVTGLSMDVFQNSLAADFCKEKISSELNGEQADSNFSRIIWMPENLRLRNEKQAKFIESLRNDKSLYLGADLIRSSPEDLKDIILEKINKYKIAVLAKLEKSNGKNIEEEYENARATNNLISKDFTPEKEIKTDTNETDPLFNPSTNFFQ